MFEGQPTSRFVLAWALVAANLAFRLLATLAASYVSWKMLWGA